MTIAILAIYNRPKFKKLFLIQLNKFKVDEIIICAEKQYWSDLSHVATKLYDFQGSIGYKRNQLINQSDSDYLIFVDEDDIQLNFRIDYQIWFLEKYNLDYMTAYNPVCYDIQKTKLFKCPEGATASTMCIRKRCKIRFADTNHYEEEPFKIVNKQDQLIYCILLNHGDNVSNRTCGICDQGLSDFLLFLSKEELLLDLW